MYVYYLVFKATLTAGREREAHEFPALAV
jgi:hypothetical protein